MADKIHGFVWGRTRFPAAPLGAAGNPALMALKDELERVTPAAVPGGRRLAKALPLPHPEPAGACAPATRRGNTAATGDQRVGWGAAGPERKFRAAPPRADPSPPASAGEGNQYRKKTGHDEDGPEFP